MPNSYPSEFRRDVVVVAMNREPGVTLEKIAADFGIHPITLSTWLPGQPTMYRPSFFRW